MTRPPPGHYELAGRGRRLGSLLLDWFIFLGPAALGIAGVGISGGFDKQPEMPISFIIVMPLIGVWGLFVMVWNIVWLCNRGQTPAKKFLGIAIRTLDGSGPTFGTMVGMRMLIPGLISAIPLLGPLFALVDACFIFREDRRCLHDLLAKTVVVDLTKEVSQDSALSGRPTQRPLPSPGPPPMTQPVFSTGPSVMPPPLPVAPKSALTPPPIQFPPPLQAAPKPLVKPDPNTLDQLEKLGALKERGILTEEEFLIEKKKLLAI